jgi:ribosomal protein S18 acetylase RimI-like enzyme
LIATDDFPEKPMLTRAGADDFELLLELRIEAMRESLERIGRFDRARARERFLKGFAPEHTRHIQVGPNRVGFVVVKPLTDALVLDHLYIHPGFQGYGIGAAVLQHIFAEADARHVPIRVTALRESDSNRFYVRHGFEKTGEEEWDIHYLRAAKVPSCREES